MSKTELTKADADIIISEAMRIMGSRRSKRKAETSRANGRKGGRPPGKGSRKRPAVKS